MQKVIYIEVFHSSSTFVATSYTHKDLRNMATQIYIREQGKAGLCYKNIQNKSGMVK